MSYLQKDVQDFNRLMEEGPGIFYFGLSFVVASIVCFLVAALTKIKRTTNNKQKKKQEQKKIILYVFGSIFAIIGLFFWMPFFIISIRFF